ncbi:heparan N-sulfatase [Rufibacter radiotolerans]|uniref:Heparan N-sulfatase n=1 Tax=Rufibacter radiotolerans TaxID=1379910 RepID=A0A0H4VUS1_9BACT|nr:sulfatase [Rufibacter radiotolerans]AKQ47672.1 heparan N-sulfatase [Rufibacter radiotolerans]
MGELSLKRIGFFLLLLGLASGQAQTAAGAAAKKPNILFCIADDASLVHMGAYGSTWVKTPAFDRVAKEGVLFLNAYTPNAKCSPSRACLLTGRNPWQLEEAANHWSNFPAKFGTFMEELGRNGYKTGFTGKGWGPGNPGQLNGKRRDLSGPAYNALKTKPPTGGISNLDYAANLEKFLDEKKAEQPFVFWFGAHEPHRQYQSGSGVAKGKKRLADIDKVPPYWPDNATVRNDMLDYAFEVEYFDAQLAKMLQMLEKRGELENTIIVVTSDNGMSFPRVKGHVYEAANHLPLAIMWKNGIKRPGRKIQDFVSFIDLAPTFMDLTQVTPGKSTMQPIQGRSLKPVLLSDKDGWVNKNNNYVLLGRERTDVGRPNDWGYPVRGIVKENFIYTINYEPDRWPAGNPETGFMDVDNSPTKTAALQTKDNPAQQYIWDLNFAKKPMEELYQFDKDPFSVKNIAPEASFAQVKKDLKAQLEKELKAQQDPRMFGKGDLFDQYKSANDKARGYYERFMKGEELPRSGGH